MSRSFGERLFTTRSPIVIVPSVIALEPGDHAQRRRLAAARRPDEDEELAVCDVDREVLNRVDVPLVDLVDVFELHLSHIGPP